MERGNSTNCGCGRMDDGFWRKSCRSCGVFCLYTSIFAQLGFGYGHSHSGGSELFTIYPLKVTSKNIVNIEKM